MSTGTTPTPVPLPATLGDHQKIARDKNLLILFCRNNIWTMPSSSRATTATASTMKRVLVGGPLLGQRVKEAGRGKKGSESTSWSTFEPLISPKFETDGVSGKTERFVLLPNARFIAVLAYKTGKRVGSLIPTQKDKEETAIESLTLVTYPKRSQGVSDLLSTTTDANATLETDEHVLLVGCRDGTLQEFDLSELVGSTSSSKTNECGPYQVGGKCYRPRRVLTASATHAPVLYLAAPPTPVDTEHGVAVYAVLQGEKDQDASKMNVSIVRLLLPRFKTSARKTVKPIDLTSLDDVQRVKVLDAIQCKITSKKKEPKKNPPFALEAVAKNPSRDVGAANQPGVFVVLARSANVTVYFDPLADPLSTLLKTPISFKSVAKSPMTAMSVSSNGKDVALGHRSGEIRVMTNILGLVDEYHTAMEKYIQQAGPTGTRSVEKPKHPKLQLIARKLHWHSHAVTTLAYDGSSSSAEPMLYSGGNESVLATWQLSRGSYKPADVLPRLALGGIVHIAGVEQAGEPNGILVYCADNSLQLFESHNRSLLWKVQGLAAGERREILQSHPSLTVDPKTKGSPSAQLVMTGLSHAPGYVHWFDPRTQEVTKTLEVAPFNRVSRTEPGDSPMPSPTITHCAWSKSGDDLMTVDTVPTENSCMGASAKLPDGSSVGVISTLRFWSIPEGGNTHVLTAAMTYPHNSENVVSAVALSLDGKLACTVSNDEKAFRIWRKTTSRDETTGRRSPVWSCQYKITTPAGYSNFDTGPSAVAFSSDATTLAITFGNSITLWDHQEMVLLTALQHIDNDVAPVETLTFLDTERLPDMILSSSSTGVSLQSPYGAKGPTNLGWAWTLPPADAKAQSVYHAEFLAESHVVVVSLYNKKTDRCRLVWIDAVTGEPCLLGGAPQVVDDIPGKILSVSGVGHAVPKAGWGRAQDKKSLMSTLCVLTATGELVMFDSKDADLSVSDAEPLQVSRATGSTIPVLSVRTANTRKRTRPMIGAPDVNEGPAEKKLSLNHFGGITGDGAASSILASAELPYLRGSFARAFVARNLRRVGS